jgi:hypothetical protein
MPEPLRVSEARVERLEVALEKIAARAAMRKQPVVGPDTLYALVTHIENIARAALEDADA